MQTFLPYTDYQKSAEVLDTKRLGKQRVECLQILKALRTGPVQNSIVKLKGFKYNGGLFQRKTPWYNHPAAKMWVGYEKELCAYGIAICQEWIRRGFKDTCLGKIQDFLKNFSDCPKPPWLSNVLCASHRSNLLRKNSTWYGQFGWTEPPDLPYVWPQ